MQCYHQLNSTGIIIPNKIGVSNKREKICLQNERNIQTSTAPQKRGKQVHGSNQLSDGFLNFIQCQTKKQQKHDHSIHKCEKVGKLRCSISRKLQLIRMSSLIDLFGESS